MVTKSKKSNRVSTDSNVSFGIFKSGRIALHSAIAALTTVGLLSGAGDVRAAWEPSLEHVDAVCREQLTNAQSAPRGNTNTSNAWLTYLYCARNAINQGLAIEQSNLRVGHRRIEVASDCPSFRKTYRRQTRDDIDFALSRAQQVNDFRLRAPETVRSKIVSAGLAEREIFRKVLREVEQLAAVRPRELTPEYVSGLVELRRRFRSLEADCLEARPPDEGSKWLLTCSGQVEIGAAQGGAFETCRAGESVLFPPGSVVRTANGSAQLVFPAEGTVVLSAHLEKNSTLLVQELKVEEGDARAIVTVEKGAVDAEARGNSELLISAGSGQRAPRCRLRRDAAARIAYDPSRAALTVDVKRQRVSVHTPFASAFGDGGQRLRFVGGKKVD